MEAARGILVVFATVFIAAECFVPVYKRDDIPAEPSDYSQSSCLNLRDACYANFRQNPHVQAVYVNISTLIDHADEICGLYQEAADCLRPSLDECDDNARPQVEASLAIDDFTCSSRGRSLLRDIQDSACYTEQNVLQTIELSTIRCLLEAHSGSVEPGNVCQQIPRIQRCAVQVTTQHCGAAAGEFMSEILQRYFSVSQPQCSNDTPQAFLKRGFSILGRPGIRSKKRDLLI